MFGGGATFGASTASSAPLFGAPASSGGGLFGAASASSLFGASASSSGLLGAPASTGGLFGAPASSSGFFGAPAASSQSPLFGAPTASSAGLFGAPATSSNALAPAATGGLFGAPAPAGGLFGAPAVASGGLFGAPAASPGGALVPAGQQQQLQVQGSAGAAASGTTEPARLQQIAEEQAALVNSLKAFDEAFTPGKGKLTRLFQYVVADSQRVRPPGIPEAQWQYALQKAGGADNESGLWPVAMRGLSDLKAHRDSQQDSARASRQCLSDLRGTIHGLSTSEEHAIRRRAAGILQTHTALAHRLLKVVRLVDGLEARVVNGSHSAIMDDQLQRLSGKLQALEAELAPNNMHGLKYNVNALSATVDLQVSGGSSATAAGVDPQSLAKAAELAEAHNIGIKSLQEHLHKVDRDVMIVKDAAKGPEMMMITTQRV